MKLKSKIVSTILSMALSLGVMGFAVYAAATQTLIVNNTVSFVSNHVLATVTGEISGAKNANAFGEARTTTATGDGSLEGALGEWDIGETVEFENELQPILITLTITNDSKERYFTFELEFANEVEESDNIIRTVSYTSVSEGQATGGTYTPVAALRVDAEAEAKIVVSLTIADTGKSVTNFNNNFSVTLRNLGTVDPVEPEEPGEPTTGDFVYNPQNKTVTVTEEKEISYLNMPEVANDTENAFFGFFTEPTHQNKVVLPYTLKPNETLYAKTGTLPEGVNLMERLDPQDPMNLNPKYELTSYTGSETSLAIPETYQNKPIVAIGMSAFENNQTIEHLDISSVEAIDSFAFRYSSIKTLISPNVKSLGEQVFGGTTNLTTLSFPKLTHLQSSNEYTGAFKDATALTSIFLPNVEEIGTGSFRNAYNLTSIDFPKAKHIGFNAFVGPDRDPMFEEWDPITETMVYNGPASQLRTVNLPVLERMDDYAFVNTNLVETFNAPDFFSIGKNAMPFGEYLREYEREGYSDFIFYKNILIRAFVFEESSISIPNNTIAIADGVFAHNTDDAALTSVSLPASLYDIGAFAFQNNTGLTTINLEHVKHFGKSSFQDTALTSINLASAETIEDDAFAFGGYGSTSGGALTQIIGGSNLKFVSTQAFRSNTGWFVEGQGLVIIGGTYLYDYSGTVPSSITLPSTVTHIGPHVFSGESALTSINLENVKYVGENAFAWAGLTTINLANAEYIGMGAFENNNLTSVSMPKVQVIEYNAFAKNSNLTSVTLPSTIKELGHAFTDINPFILIVEEIADENFDFYNIFSGFGQYGSNIVIYMHENMDIENYENFFMIERDYELQETDKPGYTKLVRKAY